MTEATSALVIVVVIQATVITALLIHHTRRRRADQRLRKSEQRFRLIAEHSPVLLWTARADTTLDFVNTTCVEFTGMSFEQLLDDGWLNAVHPEDLAHVSSIYVPAFEARRPFLMEYRLRRADGVYRWILDTASEA